MTTTENGTATGQAPSQPAPGSATPSAARKTFTPTVIGGVIAGILFLIFSTMIRDTAIIWYETRLFGIIAFFALFTAVVLGEMRSLAKSKASFPIFKYHKPIAIFAVFLVALHFAAAFLDNFKWGKGLAAVKYLGFSFGDKWLVFLSFGTIAFYLMLLLGLTSRAPTMRSLGFKRWKLIHYFSYLAFTFAYVHSVNLGTDIKTSALSVVLGPLFLAMFLFVVALFLTRVANSFALFADQWEVNLAAIFVILLLLGAALLASVSVRNTKAAAALEARTIELEAQLNASQANIARLNLTNQGLAQNASGAAP